MYTYTHSFSLYTYGVKYMTYENYQCKVTLPLFIHHAEFWSRHDSRLHIIFFIYSLCVTFLSNHMSISLNTYLKYACDICDI